MISEAMEALYAGERERGEALLASGQESIFEAAAFGRIARLEELLGADPELARSWSEDGFTPLHLACFAGGAETTRLLLERGADLEALSTASFAKVRRARGHLGRPDAGRPCAAGDMAQRDILTLGRDALASLCNDVQARSADRDRPVLRDSADAGVRMDAFPLLAGDGVPRRAPTGDRLDERLRRPAVQLGVSLA
jgi:hypothetical protein